MAVHNITCEYDSARRHIGFPSSGSKEVDWNKPVYMIHATSNATTETKLWVGLVVLARVDGKTHLLMEKTESGDYTLPIAETSFEHYSLEQSFTRKLEQIFNQDTMIVPTELLAVVQHGIVAPLLGADVFHAPVMAPCTFVPIDALAEYETTPMFEDFYPSPAFSRFVERFDARGPRTIKYPSHPHCHAVYKFKTDSLCVHVNSGVAFPGTPQLIGPSHPEIPFRKESGISVGLLFQAMTPHRSFLLRKLSSGEYGLPLEDVRRGKRRSLEEAAIKFANTLSRFEAFHRTATQMAVIRVVMTFPDADFFCIVHKIKTLYFEPPQNYEWVSFDALRWDPNLRVETTVRDLVNSEAFHHFATGSPISL